jgi:hypothetical protein
MSGVFGVMKSVFFIELLFSVVNVLMADQPMLNINALNAQPVVLKI